MNWLSKSGLKKIHTSGYNGINTVREICLKMLNKSCLGGYKLYLVTPFIIIFADLKVNIPHSFWTKFGNSGHSEPEQDSLSDWGLCYQGC